MFLRMVGKYDPSSFEIQKNNFLQNENHLCGKHFQMQFIWNIKLRALLCFVLVWTEHPVITKNSNLLG